MLGAIVILSTRKKGLNSESIDDWLDDLQVSVQLGCADEADCIQYCFEQQGQYNKIMSMRFNADLPMQEIVLKRRVIMIGYCVVYRHLNRLKDDAN